MARNWTEQQKDAINARRGSLLVSAAAGSGKTAVLVERFLQRITDPEKPSDADRLLVVTYTRAAAEEMRSRISRQIDQLLEKDPGNLHLRRQQVLVAQAHISTIHSFCADLIRENFFRLSVAPDFRILEDTELGILREDVLSRVLERYYAQKDPAFFALAEAFSVGRDDRKMADAIGSLYDFIRSHPFPKRWLREKAAMYHTEQPFSQTPWGEVLLQHAIQVISYGKTLIQGALESMQGQEDMQKAWQEAYEADMAELEGALEQAREKQWDGLVHRFQGLSWMRTKPLRGRNGDPVKEKISDARKQMHKLAEGLQDIFSFNEEECREEILRTAQLADKLFEVTEAFGEELDREKALRKAADFSDLEHWALRLLVRDTPEGPERTEDAREIAARFDEIMVDEYQDTNEAQDQIFQAVSRDGSNLFMVGDVKQSIYRFRQAMPEIFLRRREEYPLYNRQEDSYPACVILDRNFRSASGITDGVNFVFRQLMSRETGEMEYTEAEELKTGAVYPPASDPAVALDLIDLSSGDEKDAVAAESRCMAERIYQLTARGTITEDGESRPVRLSDICILLRSHKAYGPDYARELCALGIPAYAEKSGGFFAAPEVKMLLSFLKVIDNPTREIPLLAVLMGPVYGFTPDDMAELRIRYKRKSLYASLLAAAQEDHRFCRFQEDFSRFRVLAATLSSDRLIAAICRETGYGDLLQAAQGGRERLANLHLLQDYASRYEASGYSGLSGFLRFIARLEKQKVDLPEASGSETPDAVRIMSIHKSKGLEFPVCFLAGCARNFNKEKSDLLLHPVLGMGAKLPDPDTGARRNTLPREAVALELERGEMSEELRVLYVAMTRAKEKLIAVAAVEKADSFLSGLAGKIKPGEKLHPYAVRSCRSIAQWLWLCALRHPDGGMLRERADLQDFVNEPAKEPWEMRILRSGKDPVPEEEQGEILKASPDEAICKELQEKVEYGYPYQAAEDIPTKITASEMAAKKEALQYRASSRPSFLSQNGMTPAEKGTALHQFLQFARWEEAAAQPEQEIRRLVEQAYITPEQGEAVDRKRLASFFASPLARRILHSHELYREYRFTVELPACKVYPECSVSLEEKVVLQGAVDCAFEEEGEIVLVDFKTDRMQREEEFRERYRVQLELYKDALEQCLEKPVKQCILYSFHLEKEILL